MAAPAPSAKPTDYPLVAYNYRVIVGAIAMRFSKVEGLVWERSAVTYRDGLSFLDGESISTYYINTYTTLTLSQGVVVADSSLHDWLRQGDARLLQVQLCQADGQPKIAWQANRAIPVKLTGANLDTQGNEVVVERLELRAKGWSIKHPF
jgi:phage tail-like protein